MATVRHRGHKNTMRARRAEVEDRAQDVRDSIQQLGTSVKHAARDGVASLRSTANDYLGQGRAKAGELEHSAEERIRQNPLAALCVAMGIGFVVGAMFMRR